jgi:hypothetical protein
MKYPKNQPTQNHKCLIANGNVAMADFMLPSVALASLYADESCGPAGKVFMRSPKQGKSGDVRIWPEMIVTRTTRLMVQAWTAWTIPFCGALPGVQGCRGEKP